MEFIADRETWVVHDLKNYKNIFAMIPCVMPRTGKGLAMYIQSLHQYQRNQELKSLPTEVYQEHMKSQRRWLLR